MLCFKNCMRGCGRIERPAFPAPSDWRADEFMHTSGKSCRENANLCLNVIASVAKQSILPRKERMDCFVAALLAMTNFDFLAV
jgi:hypothetical protein